MDNNKELSGKERITFLEGELKRSEKDLAQKVREIEVEKALEIVRVKALAMRSSSELSETSTILFQQLKELKIDAIRSGVAIFDDDGNAIELWVTSIADDGGLSFVLDYINIHVHPVFEKMIEARRSQDLYVVTNLEGKDLLHYYKTMSTYTGIPNRQENIYSEFFYSFFFSAGTINVVTSKALTAEESNIMLRVANAFGLIYTRFLDLKRMEEQAILIKEEKKTLESTLDNLKAAQKQLIQSEKMASLGELTAGIAHEIQNPLNFVNNFSEVNKELLIEMSQEIDKNNFDEVKAIAKDVISNEEKINHHGKRADTIVKGMLQHSRSSTGRKEPADINALADEYLRLAYLGLRSKDNSFEPVMNTDLDRTIGKINIIPQDIGRVLLNLYNNAFYTLAGKLREASNGYEPVISVSSKKNADRVLISVKDNGNGIPQKVIDKIFQPFFTTKPTGEGTGLGLSLSYDIIKAHGGEIRVITKENEGTKLIIDLPLT
jgi:signal transduction histidine kinase